MRAGFIGLGSQGAPMARRILDAGFPLALWARRQETLAPFSGTAAHVAASPAAVAARSDVVGVCVVADADVEEVVLGDSGVLAGMADGGIVVVHSTIHPETCRRIAAVAAGQGVRVIDAPVSGGGPAAAQGRLLVMVGGDAATVDEARPVLAAFGDPILHMGPLGSGQTAKVLNNFVFTAQLAVALETFRFAAEMGIDREAAASVLANGSGGSRAANIVAGGGFGTASLKQVAATLLAKDVAIMADLAARAGTQAPPHLEGLAEAALRMYADG